MASGQMVPTPLVLDLLLGAMLSTPPPRRFLVDGFPRQLEQLQVRHRGGAGLTMHTPRGMMLGTSPIRDLLPLRVVLRLGSLLTETQGPAYL